MPVTNATLYSILTAPAASNGLFMGIGGAIYKACVAIQNESGGTANHANRLLFANAVMADVVAKLPEKSRRMLADVLADSTIGALADPLLATDTQIETRVNGLLSVASILATYGV